MGEKPKNFSEAIDQLENATNGMTKNLYDQLKGELSHLEETLEKIKPEIENIKGKVTHEAKRAKDSVETQVKENPWAAIGIVGLIFFILGLLFGGTFSRRKD